MYWMEMKASMTLVDAKAQHEAHMPWCFTGARFFFQSKATGSGVLKEVGYCKIERHQCQLVITRAAHTLALHF